MTRRFSVNSTLGSLGVVPSRVLLRRRGGKVEVRWSQSRAARVRVTIETPAGLVVRRVWNAALQPGEQSVLWDGRSRKGAPVANGRYIVRVTATNELGSVVLTHHLTIRRVKG
jgi:flagellar hook assembly protein FlgD